MNSTSRHGPGQRPELGDGRFLPSSNGDEKISPQAEPEPDSFKDAYDWHFVVLNKGDEPIVVRCSKPSRGFGLTVACSSDVDIERFVEGNRVIVIGPENGTGKDEAYRIAKDLRYLTEKMVLWPCPGLGSEEVPDLVTFEEFYGQGEEGSLARALAFDHPWTWPPFMPASRLPHANGNGNGKHALAASIKSHARLTRASDVSVKPIEWLWEPRIPLGMLTLFAGDPKLGKSLSTVGITAAVSCGKPLPMDQAKRGAASVIMMSAEDDTARVIVPRLKAAGACLDRVHILESIVVPGGVQKDGEREAPSIERLPSILANDILAIEEAAAGLGDCRLIIIDPVTAYLSGVDDHRNTELRAVLWPLKAMAERLNAAVILVTHMSKGGATQAKHRVIGSIAWVGACRANFLFIKDGNDASGRRVLMCDNGTNLAPEVPTLSYIIEERGDGPMVAWGLEPVRITADEALLTLSRDADQQAERRELDHWLCEMLANGPVLVDRIERAAKDEKLSFDQIKRAKTRIGATTDREGFGKGSKCFWRLGNVSAKEA